MNARERYPHLSAEQTDLIEQYLDLLLAANERMNLTAVRDRDEMYARHVSDSLSAAPLIPNGMRVIDIGCGAGLPSLILKIANPTLSFLLVDSVKKKVDFVNETIAALGLTDIRAVHSRIEDIDKRDFDFVVARAVAPLNILMEYALPLLHVGGTLLAYKGDAAEEEIAASANALKVLNACISEVADVSRDTFRHCIVCVEKTAPTPPRFPRPKNLPRTKPL